MFGTFVHLSLWQKCPVSQSPFGVNIDDLGHDLAAQFPTQSGNDALDFIFQYSILLGDCHPGFFTGKRTMLANVIDDPARADDRLSELG